MKILIVEDEPVVAKRIERLTKEILDKRVISIKKVTTLKEAKSYLMLQQIDLLFLDLNLKGKDGFDVLDNIQADSFYTIIISAYNERAIKAFNYPIFDFIEKPFDKDRLIKAFEKVNNFDLKNNFTSKFLSLKMNSEIRLVEIDKIIYLKGAGVYSELFLVDEKKVLHHQNLEKVNLLLPTNFVRVHKSYIVNFYFVQKIIIHGGSKYSIKLINDVILPISRNRYSKIKNMFEQ